MPGLADQVQPGLDPGLSFNSLSKRVGLLTSHKSTPEYTDDVGKTGGDVSVLRMNQNEVF